MKNIQVSRESIQRAAINNSHSDGSANAAVTITIAAVERECHVLTGLIFSYDDDPTGGEVTVSIGGVEVFKHAITRGGPGPLMEFVNGLTTRNFNEALVVTLAAGGAGITGHLTIFYA